jgi:NADH-quinone oxidoreductase subunit I
MIDFLKKILLIDILKGLWVTLRYTFKKKVTFQYPEQVKEPRLEFRGILRLYHDDQNQPLCIGCKMCQRSCPDGCFTIESAKDETGKMRPNRFDWDMSRCCFCGLCVEACPTHAIRFSKQFRMASQDKHKFLFDLSSMYDHFDTQKHFKGE